MIVVVLENKKKTNAQNKKEIQIQGEHTLFSVNPSLGTDRLPDCLLGKQQQKKIVA